MNLNHLLFEYLYFFHTLPDKSVLMAYLAYLEWCDGVERASATFVPPPGSAIYHRAFRIKNSVLNFWEIT